jgi:chromosome partitioning protein
MRTIAVINQKGGCGKTTVAVNLAAALGELEKKVLLVDMDPQSHASLSLDVSSREVDHTTYDLLRNPRVMVEDSIIHYGEHLDVIPSSPVLGAVEQELAGRDGRETRLASKLARVESSYDYAVIDSPPNVGLLTFNALMAAGEVLIPVDPSYYSLQGVGRLLETVELLEEETRHRVKVYILVNNIEKRTNFSREIVIELERLHGAEMLDVAVSHSVKYKEAALRGVPIFGMTRCDRLKWEFLTLAREVEDRQTLIETSEIGDWMEKLHGPRVAQGGVIFTVDAPAARTVRLTGEFINWSPEGIRMEKDGEDGLWKAAVDLEPGEYEYRFIIDGVWIKDPRNVDSVLNEFGQENSLLIV